MWDHPMMMMRSGQFDRNSISQLIGWLQQTQREEHKVLAAFVDYTERTYDEDRYDYPHKSIDHVIALLEQGKSMCWESWYNTFLLGTDMRPKDHKGRELLRHSRRLLNFAARLVNEALDAVPRCKASYNRRHLLEQMEKLTSSFASTLADEDGQRRHFRHPEATKWLRLHAQCKRQLAAHWLEEARTIETKAKRADVVCTLPADMSGVTLEQMQELGFYRQSLSDDSSSQEVHLPAGWHLERKDDADEGRLIDRYDRPRANIVFVEREGRAPHMTFILRYVMVQVEKDGKFGYAVRDNRSPREEPRELTRNFADSPTDSRLVEDAERWFYNYARTNTIDFAKN